MHRGINFGSGYGLRRRCLNVSVDPACEPDVLIVNDGYAMLPVDSFDEVMANDFVGYILRSRTAGIVPD